MVGSIFADTEICTWCDSVLSENVKMHKRSGTTYLFCGDKHCCANWLAQDHGVRRLGQPSFAFDVVS